MDLIYKHFLFKFFIISIKENLSLGTFIDDFLLKVFLL
jgi:hypothetical protein